MKNFSNFCNCISRLTSRRGLAFVCGTALLLLLPANLHGQAVSRINGDVTDQAGAEVPDAKVTVTNVDTNVSQTTTTTSVGTYLIIDLIPGAYVVKVEKTGFKAYVSKNVTVVGGATSTVNATLEPGTVTETIEVTAPAITLQTEQPEIGTTLNETLLGDLPQIISGQNRQIDAFIFLVPGVTGNAFSHRINGGADQQTEVMFNGVPEAWSETAGFTSWNQPPYDSIKDVDILTGTFSAQYGLGQGVEQYRAKSGTNQIHGSAFGFYRDAFFDAPGAHNDIFGNNAGKLDAPNTDHEINWGFSVGGPVILPKIYDGHNKTFWYFSWDKYRQAKGQGPVTMPTQAEVGGDFSQLTNPASGALIPIFVPLAWGTSPSLIPSGCTLPTTGPGSPGTQWPGNKIPTSCFSTVSQSLLALKDIPSPSIASLEVSNYNPAYVPINDEKAYSVNIDHNLTVKQALHGWWWWQNFPQPGGWSNNALSNGIVNKELGKGLDITYSNTFSPHLVMTAGFLYVYQKNDFFPLTFFPGNFAGAQPFSNPVTGSKVFLPGITFTGAPFQDQCWGTNGCGGWTFSINHKTGYSILNNWLWQHSRHTINFGVDIRKTHQNDFECQQCGGSFNFDAQTTADPNEQFDICGSNPNCNSAPGTNTGFGFASFLIGNANSAGRLLAGNTNLRNTYVAPYFQDDMQITSRLKLNWGVRWDLAFPFTNDNSTNQLTFFSPIAANTGAISPVTGKPLLGAMTELGATSSACPLCVGWNHMDMFWDHLSPRIGFTYQLNSKTVLLGGVSWYWLDTGAFEYGVNKVAVNYGNNLNGTLTGFDAGSKGSIDCSGGTGNGCVYSIPGYGLWDSNGQGPLPTPSSPGLTPSFFNTGFPSAAVKHVNQGYDEQFIVGVQRELPWNMFLSVHAVHTHDLHLPAELAGPGRMNYLDYKFVQSQCAPGLANFRSCVLGQSWTSPAAQALMASQASQYNFGQFTYAPGTCGGNSVPVTYFVPYDNFCQDYGAGGLALRAFLRFPQFRGITNDFDTSGADKYNALQVSLQKRTGSGLTYLVSYTLSRYLSNTDSGFSTFNFKGLNPGNPNAEWSVGNNDQTHVLTMAGAYELPIGPGKKFLNHGGRAMKNLVGGWELSMINWYESGSPLQLFSGCSGTFNCTPLGYTAQNRPNILSGPLGLDWNNTYKGTTVLNTAKFAFPGAWTIGNAAPLYNNLRNPAYSDEDVSLKKKFFFTERFSGEISMEYFNVLNRMQVGNCIDNGAGDANFGLQNSGQANVPCQGNTPRQGQVKLQIFF
jgi:hypothetical protein